MGDKNRVVIFKFDKEKDLYNIWDTCNYSGGYGYDFTKNVPAKIMEICKGKEYKECKNILKKRFKEFYENKLIKDFVNVMNTSWKRIEKEYFKRLGIITGDKFVFKRVYSYPTSVSRCPYNPNSKPPIFYVQIFNSLPNCLAVAGHELMHIHLHNLPWWKNTEKEIGYDNTNNLKEALTELLNLEFKDLWFVEDKSYPNHVQLREFIKEEWKKEKDFHKLTDSCIRWIKENGIK